MSDARLADVLPQLDEEIFYAVLDVALDINNELIVRDGSRAVYIESTRTLVRYPVLYPGHSVGAMYRYVDLRGKGIMFLEKFGFVESMKYHKTGLSGFEGRFEVAVRNAASFGPLLAELRAEEIRRNPRMKIENDVNGATARIMQLADSFHRVVLRLRDRRSGRPPLLISDEYDVQYLFGALLQTRFEDVRPEEWTPSHAGAPSRIDFFLKNESVIVETKMTREGLTDKKLGKT